MPLKFVIKKGTTGKFGFSLVSRNGQVIATSDQYSSRAAALGGVRSIRTQAADATIEDQSTKAWAADQARQGDATTKRAAKKVAASAPAPAPRKARAAPKPAAPAEKPSAAAATKAPSRKRAAKAAPAAAPPEPAPAPAPEPASPPRKAPAAAGFAEPDLTAGSTRRVVSMRAPD